MVAFALLTPFFFIRSGMNVSLGAVGASLGLLGLLLLLKVALKFIGVYPLARHWVPEHAAYTTLLMSTGLTFGTISATYGYNAGIIDRTQFSALVAVVVLSAVVPTAIAQRLFTPQVAPRPSRLAGRSSRDPRPPDARRPRVDSSVGDGAPRKRRPADGSCRADLPEAPMPVPVDPDEYLAAVVGDDPETCAAETVRVRLRLPARTRLELAALRGNAPTTWPDQTDLRLAFALGLRHRLLVAWRAAATGGPAERRRAVERLFDAVYSRSAVGRFEAYSRGQAERRLGWSLGGRTQAVRAAEQSLLPRIEAFNQRAARRAEALRELLGEAGR